MFIFLRNANGSLLHETIISLHICYGDSETYITFSQINAILHTHSSVNINVILPTNVIDGTTKL